MRVLISGFEPFAGGINNPSGKLVEAIQNKEISYPDNIHLEAILLPVRFIDCFELLKERIISLNPDVIISFGLASDRSNIELEHLAINQIDAKIPDNSGTTISNIMINQNGPDHYFSTLPVQGIEATLKNEGLPVVISKSAGTFVCNYLFYKLMEDNQDTQRLCGFIHIPAFPGYSTKDATGLSYEDLKKSLSLILKYINY